MTIDYGLLALAVGLIYAILLKWFPDFPITQEILLAIALWAVAKVGVVIIGEPLKGSLRKRGYIIKDE